MEIIEIYCRITDNYNIYQSVFKFIALYNKKWFNVVIYKMKTKNKKIVRYLGIALIVIGICVIAYPFYTNFVVKNQEADVLEAWDKQLSSVSGETSEAAVTSEPGEETDTKTISESAIPVDTSGESLKSEETLSEELFILDPAKKIPFKIIIPKIGVEKIVHEGTSTASLKRGPGHYTGTSLPGELGLCIIAGHRTTYGAPFNRVDRLEIGDEIILQTANGDNFIYYMTAKTEVKPDDVSVLNQTAYPSLALTTCTPKFYATRRLIIFADMKH